MQEERGREQASSEMETKVGGPSVSNSPPLGMKPQPKDHTAGCLSLSRHCVHFPLFLQETLVLKSPILNVSAKTEVSGNEETRLSRGKRSVGQRSRRSPGQG